MGDDSNLPNSAVVDLCVDAKAIGWEHGGSLVVGPTWSCQTEEIIHDHVRTKGVPSKTVPLSLEEEALVQDSSGVNQRILGGLLESWRKLFFVDHKMGVFLCVDTILTNEIAEFHLTQPQVQPHHTYAFMPCRCNSSSLQYQSGSNGTDIISTHQTEENLEGHIVVVPNHNCREGS